MKRYELGRFRRHRVLALVSIGELALGLSVMRHGPFWLIQARFPFLCVELSPW